MKEPDDSGQPCSGAPVFIAVDIITHNDVKISAFPEGEYFGPNYFHNVIEKWENPQFSRHYDNNAMNIGQHYFHNEDLSEAKIFDQIMKIIWTKILTLGKGRNFHVIMGRVISKSVFWS